MKHIRGLDSWRFLCALIVMMGHLNLALPGSGSLHRPVEMFWENAFNGPAAVIVFFVISGFVIHLPQTAAESGPLRAGPFYARRIVRIGIPSLAVAAIYLLVGADISPPDFGVLWSIICEAIYYLLYPVFLLIAGRYGWKRMIVSSAVVAMLASGVGWRAVVDSGNGYAALGLWTWVAGLPIWLAGCWLAEDWHGFPKVDARHIWALRFGVLGISIVLRVVKFHLPSPWGSNLFWLSLFAIPVVIWLGYEARNSETMRVSPVLERFGKWSYSLYLVHPAVIAVAHRWSAAWTPVVGLLTLVAALILAWLYYLVVEMPSHNLARRLARSLSRAGYARVAVQTE